MPPPQTPKLRMFHFKPRGLPHTDSTSNLHRHLWPPVSQSLVGYARPEAKPQTRQDNTKKQHTKRCGALACPTGGLHRNSTPEMYPRGTLCRSASSPSGPSWTEAGAPPSAATGGYDPVSPGRLVGPGAVGGGAPAGVAATRANWGTSSSEVARGAGGHMLRNGSFVYPTVLSVGTHAY